ncbi:U3 snoRNP protein, IMP4 (nucleomorph) [Cryptomonas paramecium]|uniref:U3 snoRNP protein, IMP4 n=1 Tax=Cryptomonas paramaecium TaxID=2898 RepID=F2HHZ4_9CRYP|nr:U3 snoRNP protein, IMP4 [Cryptomonas paramecium]AEA38940.1 U3 snoRNP protein, IMP4 [Cryptomonas paramecium]|mmetsp:Transcript_52419/g.137248  ORF Transcript_52419/g.137248 Transcript_52419/m.137248 type:complete len:216 (+) Transcript_52419:7435-8082(+)
MKKSITFFSEKSKIIITTSKNPSRMSLNFIKKLNIIFPCSHRVNRGNLSLKSLIRFCIIQNVANLILVYQIKNKPSCMVIFHLPSGPTLFFKLFNVITSAVEKKLNLSHQSTLVVIEGFGSPLGKCIIFIFISLFSFFKKNFRKIIFLKEKKSFVFLRCYWFFLKEKLKKKFFLEKIHPNFDMYLFKISLEIFFQQKKIAFKWYKKPGTAIFIKS